MANELRVRAELKYTPSVANQIAIDTGLLKKDVTMTGADHQQGTQVIGTTEEQIVIVADIGTLGYVFVRNLDATNFLQVGVATGEYAIKLKPGEFALFRAAASALYAIADTAACSLQYYCFED